MARRKLVQGFDYEAGKLVEMTPVAWRQKYPPPTYRRAVLDGDTWYRIQRGGSWRLVAEAYAVIPEGKQ